MSPARSEPASARPEPIAFTGFPPESLRFLESLASHNETAWFDANRATSDDALIEPARELVIAVGERLAAVAPDINAAPRVNGSIFRINRDRRLATDRRPDKEHLDLMWWRGAGRSRGRPGFFVGRGGGLHAFLSLPSPAALRETRLGDLIATHFVTLGPFCEHVRRIIDNTL